MYWTVRFNGDVGENCTLTGEFFLEAPDIDSVLVFARNKIAKMTDRDPQITKIEQV